MGEPYTTVIGLEVHVQLATESKLFCRCSTQFGAAPNTQTCPICIGMPGTLPVMNEHAFELALRTGVALNCEIPAFTKWDRKQYYYPDLPKGYQISQYDLPLAEHGYLEISDEQGRFPPKKVGIIRAHLEEDAGKSIHDEVSGKAASQIDLNRTGTPLLEIVSEPDLRSSTEAKAFLKELKLLLMYINVSDCNMQEGSLRVDANVNLHVVKESEKLATPIVEVKNMNSFRAVERALDYESARQYRQWQESGHCLGDVPKTTRGWDDAANVTRPQRSKEESSDYRYFPDPDLVPIQVAAERVTEIRNELGELPAPLRQRLAQQYAISAYDADVIVNQGRELVEFYVVVAEASGDGKLAANWVTQEVLRVLNDDGVAVSELGVTPDQLSALISKQQAGELPAQRSREVFAAMRENQWTVAEAMQSLGIEKIDESELVELCRQLVEANPRIAADVKEGKAKAVGALIGQAKQQNPNVDPQRVREICLQVIAESG